MANLKVSIIERIKTADGTWTTKPVRPKLRPDGGLYLRDDREGKFLLTWREGSQRRYSDVIMTMREALAQKKQKELYLASIANGLVVEDPTDGKVRLTVAAAINQFLDELTGADKTSTAYTYSLRQFEQWNQTARTKKTYVDQIDRPHLMLFKKFLETEIGNDQFTSAWKCVRVNKMIKTALHLGAGQGPVKTSDFSDVLNRKPTVTTYSKEEREKFLSACTGTKLVVWTLFLKCGLRYQELSHLEWSDVDWQKHVVLVRRKLVKSGDKTVEFIPKKWSVRDVALPSDVYAMLQKLQTTQLPKSHLVFPTRSGRVNPHLWDNCKRIAKRAGLDASKFKPKNFRSTYATNRLLAGYSLPEVRDQLGHRDMHSIEHYLSALKSEQLARSGRADAGWDN